MLSDFYVKFKFATYTFISRVYAIDTVNNKFLVTYDEGQFRWIDISKCELYDPVLDDDYDDY